MLCKILSQVPMHTCSIDVESESHLSLLRGKAGRGVKGVGGLNLVSKPVVLNTRSSSKTTFRNVPYKTPFTNVLFLLQNDVQYKTSLKKIFLF